jgi:hypothetical protein
MRRHLEITLGDNWAEVRGWGSRDLLKELTGRSPVYNTRTRSWCTTPKRARDLAVLAEVNGYDVTVTAAPAREVAG